MYYLILPNLDARTDFIAYLKAGGIQAVFHYLPLHLSEYASRWGGRPGDCPVTEDISNRLLRLPLYTRLSDSEQERVIKMVTAWSPGDVKSRP